MGAALRCAAPRRDSCLSPLHPLPLPVAALPAALSLLAGVADLQLRLPALLPACMLSTLRPCPAHPCRTWVPPASRVRGSGLTAASSGSSASRALRRRRAACTTCTPLTSARGEALNHSAPQRRGGVQRRVARRYRAVPVRSPDRPSLFFACLTSWPLPPSLSTCVGGTRLRPPLVNSLPSSCGCSGVDVNSLHGLGLGWVCASLDTQRPFPAAVHASAIWRGAVACTRRSLSRLAATSPAGWGCEEGRPRAVHYYIVFQTRKQNITCMHMCRQIKTRG